MRIFWVYGDLSATLYSDSKYEGMSNENLKGAIKIRKHSPIVCKLTTVIFVAGRVADRWQVGCRNATRRRSSSVKMAAPLATCNLRSSCDSPS